MQLKTLRRPVVLRMVETVAGLILWTCLINGLLPLQASVIQSGKNVDPHPEEAGERPYEMAGRSEERKPLATFEDCTQWEVVTQDAQASLYRSEERKLYRDYCGKLVYRSTGNNPEILVRLKRPQAITGEWDCVNFWNWGNCWAWEPRQGTPALQVAAVVEGADCQRHELDLGLMEYKYWFLSHAKVREKIAYPAKFIGILFRNGTNKQERSVFLGPIYFYQEKLLPLTFEPWPAKLPFPMEGKTILPSNNTACFRNSVRHTPEETMFMYDGADCKLAFRYRPVTGTLSDLSVLFKGKEIFPCKGGGIQFSGKASDSPQLIHRLKSQRLSGNVLTAQWQSRCDDICLDITYRLSMRQKSLIVEIEEKTGGVENVVLGHAEPIHDAKLIWVPYLTFGYKPDDPRVLYADGLFYFTQFDWFHSNASALFARHWLRGKQAVFNRGARYAQKTDGRRNALRERLFINVSPDFSEVLPTIPNPPSAMRNVQRERVWRMSWGGDIKREIAEARLLRALGLEHVTIRYHESNWRDRGESYTFRLNAAPRRGGDAALKRLISSVQACDWLVGAYTNYTDFAPVNSFWNEDWITRTQQGDWLKAWTRCYAPKPMMAVQMEARLAPQLKRKFGMNHSYCDVHTAVTPFERVDYDARVPGAGTFRRTFECFGRLLLNEKAAYGGPVYSEGRNHWWYAGLTDGNYAQLTCADPPQEPLLVDFDLLKMHPLQMDAGMGNLDMFYRCSKTRNYRQYMATTLAYGHIGFLDGSINEMMKMYYMLQPLQKHYVMVPVRRIAYAHGTELMNTSEALSSGAYENGRVHVTYEKGMSVWVNGGNQHWQADVDAPLPAELPQWGFLATTNDPNTFAYSGLAHTGGPNATSGPKCDIDLAHGPYSHYLDTHGPFVFAGNLAGAGGAALKHEPGGWELIPAPDFAAFGFSPSVLGLPDRNFKVEGVNQEGKSMGPASVRWSRGKLYVLRNDHGAFKYRLCPQAALPPKQPKCKTTVVIPGEELVIQLPQSQALEGKHVFWSVGHREIPSLAKRTGHTLKVIVPQEIPLQQHLWLRLPTNDQDLWLIFLSEAAYGLQLETSVSQVRRNEMIPVNVTVTNQIRHRRPVALTLSCDKGKFKSTNLTIDVSKAEKTMVPNALALPWGNSTVALKACVNDGIRQVTMQKHLKLELKREELIDLTKATWTKGYCLRNKAEILGGDTMYEGDFKLQTSSCGGVRMTSIFTHPPWGPNGTGYIFGMTTLRLPAKPAALQWHMGRADRTNAGDGLTFKVIVLDGDRQHQVFSQHYNQVRWTLAEVDLSAYAGQTITLKLIADCGPQDDSTADHGNWGSPRIVSQQEQMTIRQEK